MSRLADRLAEDLKDAMRAGESVRRDEIRSLLSAIKAQRHAKLTQELDRRGLIIRDESSSLTAAQKSESDQLRSENDLTDDEEQAVVRQRAKQHWQSIDGFEKGNRSDLVAIEQTQLAVLQTYLPQQLGSQEVEEAIRQAIGQSGASGSREQGKVMGLLSAQLRGKADLKQVSARVQALLAGGD